jgi:hypothetical protein
VLLLLSLLFVTECEESIVVVHVFGRTDGGIVINVMCIMIIDIIMDIVVVILIWMPIMATVEQEAPLSMGQSIDFADRTRPYSSQCHHPMHKTAWADSNWHVMGSSEQFQWGSKNGDSKIFDNQSFKGLMTGFDPPIQYW